MNYILENETIVCRCKSELVINYSILSGFNEKEDFFCPNCHQIHKVRAALPITKNNIRVVKKGIDKESNDLNPEIIHDILLGKEISNLFHANTLLTSLTFFKHKSLLSREYVENNKLEQTSQYSDELDKEYGIFNDIFMDTIDIHDRAKKMNLYGPILFAFPLKILIKDKIPFIRITKKNPTKWNENDNLEDRYYTSEKEFEDNYNKGDFNSMIIFPYLEGQLELNGNLSFIKIDNPKLEWNDNKKDLHIEAKEKLIESARIGEVDLNNIGLSYRSCDELECKCINEYKNHLEIKKLYR